MNVTFGHEVSVRIGLSDIIGGRRMVVGGESRCWRGGMAPLQIIDDENRTGE